MEILSIFRIIFCTLHQNKSRLFTTRGEKSVSKIDIFVFLSLIIVHMSNMILSLQESLESV